ncbi:type IV secretory pathway protease TraF [Sphingobium sp. B2D3A]|uniref:S26 family signal peptidase n=1 Tax=unclassified Sphingobium TaxID=2611147 RepID=UPI002224640F|nr:MULTISPECIES: peptidase [unclassified Sphingobium]MCW2338205.1 type IV secretory pathway protease TraF [Sphingobium sp. B2D3A]MCW2384664.1 type IV secretory pathway protease TraF [Sphingobium sp. B2D3D]
MLRLFWLLANALRAILRALTRLPRELGAALGAPDPDTPARPRRLWIAIGFAMPTALFAAWFVPQITLVMSPSIEAWAVRKAPGPIVRGDYVMYTLTHPIAGPKPVNVTKHALCMPGDRLTWWEVPSLSRPRVRDTRFFCNGDLLGTALPFTRDGRRLAHANWSGVIPAGLVYIGSHHPQGFDSRYFGLVEISRLSRMQRLL